MIRVSFPGKLFLMGEYAVMETGRASVVMSVDQRLSLTLEKSETWTLNSSFGTYHGESVYAMSSMKEVSAALVVFEQFLGQKLMPCHIEITSELDEGDRKYGFGSSGVVIVAVISALLQNYEIEYDKMSLFKLCVLVQKHLGNYSSGGDLAAAIFDCVIEYRRYDVQWLNESRESVRELILMEWPKLVIKKLCLLDSYSVVIGWTGKSNRTDNYLKKVNTFADLDPMTYHSFLLAADRYVEMFLSAKDYRELSHAMAQYCDLMKQLGSWAQIDIETHELNLLIETSLSLGFAAKVSGSGGGDCGITIVPKDTDVSELKNLWNLKNIKML